MDPTKYFKHDVTHWVVTGSDGFGGFLFSAPTLYKGRWEDTAVQFRTMKGEEETSNAVVYLPIAVAIGDYVAQGDHETTSVANPTSVDGHRVRQRHSTTDLRNMSVLHKAFI